MTITAEVIKDSQGPTGKRITTFLLTYPRYIHAELMTHRVFSRNAASSRAIPAKRSIEMVQNDPVRPIVWTSNQPGMQGGERLPVWDQELAERAWDQALDACLAAARRLQELNVHKQYGNRLLECFSHITVVVTATQWANWYALRYHPMAMPEIHELARLMFAAHKSSEPQQLDAGHWHLPFVDDIQGFQENIWRSVACCARTSYLKHDKTDPSIEEDKALYDRLLASAPLHASPAEHQAIAIRNRSCRSGNFLGWVQYRQTLPHESAATFTSPDGELWCDE